MWKQDASVSEIGIRKAFLPGLMLAGPKDGRISIQACPSSHQTPWRVSATPRTQEFDAVHTFYRRAADADPCPTARGGAVAPWQWNSASNTDAISVFPRRRHPKRLLQSQSQGVEILLLHQTRESSGTPQVFTCRSFDIVAHETGHAILDGLKPGWLDHPSNQPQTGGLHEWFGDLCAIFLTLSQLDQVER